MADTILNLIIQIGTLIVSGIIAVEIWLRAQLEQFGLAPALQTTILAVLAIILIVGSIRLFGGLIRVAVVLMLLLMAMHILFPVFGR
jgi:hypothetical protein